MRLFTVFTAYPAQWNSLGNPIDDELAETSKPEESCRVSAVGTGKLRFAYLVIQLLRVFVEAGSQISEDNGEETSCSAVFCSIIPDNVAAFSVHLPGLPFNHGRLGLP